MPWIPRLFYLYWSFKPILWELNLPSPRVSPSHAPIFSCAHYFQAPASQAKLNPFLLLKLIFSPTNLYLSLWPRDWIYSIRPTKVQDRDCRKAAWPVWLLKTLPPNGPFVPNNFFRPRTICKEAIIKTTSAIIPFSFLLVSFSCFSLFSFPFPLLVWVWTLSKETCLLTPFHFKWRQISLGLFSKHRQLDIYRKNDLLQHICN